MYTPDSKDAPGGAYLLAKRCQKQLVHSFTVNNLPQNDSDPLKSRGLHCIKIIVIIWWRRGDLHPCIEEQPQKHLRV